MVVKTLPNFSRYLFREDGEIITFRFKEPRPLIGGVDKNGYKKHTLVTDEGDVVSVRRSAMICEAFHGPRPDKHVVRHIDGSKNNDRPDNLCWGTQKENCQDKIKHGTYQIGSRNPNAKVNENVVRQIRLRLGSGTLDQVAAEFETTRDIIWQIKHRRTWGWLV